MSEEGTIPQMRERIEALEKQLKAQESASADLAKENRLLKARDVFRGQGYDPIHGELFATSTDGDITAEAVDEFAKRYGLNPTAQASEPASQEAEPSVDASSSEMSGFSRAGSGAGSGDAAGPQADLLTRDDWVALSKSNPAAAKEAVARGQVKLRADNPYVRT